MEALAEFHATTYHVINESYGGIEKFRETYPELADLKPMGEGTKQTFKTTLDKIVGNIETLAREFVSDEVAERFVQLGPELFPTLESGLHKPRGRFQTLIHGDSWANNAMFNTGSGAVKMFDFQCARISSPAVDLAYCIITGNCDLIRAINLHSKYFLFRYH